MGNGSRNLGDFTRHASAAEAPVHAHSFADNMGSYLVHLLDRLKV